MKSESDVFIKPEFPVVAIGASAGGMEAFGALLKKLPEKTGLAYIYVQHLDPTHESNLISILSRQTSMPVLEATHEEKLAPDHLYIIPPNKEIQLVDGIIAVSPRPSQPYSHMPINRFFVSVAERYKESAVGIILSGSATDGTIGLKAIKMEGGVTFAQDNSAKFESMPKSAIAEGAVDLVLSPDQMADELVRLANDKDIYFSILQESKKENDQDEQDNLKGVLQILLKSVGVDFTQYKMNTIKRRIVRRMILYKITSFAEYLQYLKEHAQEINSLYQDLLINVTTFFRDKETYDYLSNTLVPKIIQPKSANDPIRVWVPACSTGQEAYSIAMVLMETLGQHSLTRPVQIFATDLSEGSINRARIGVYSKEEITDVSPARLQRFFTKTDGAYRINKSIRDLCIFASHNILKDPPFSRLDIISCCNLMIYLDVNLQRRVLATFHYALATNGYLILGKSETIGNSAYLYSQLDKKLKIYQKKKDSASRAIFDLNLRHGDFDKFNTEAPKPTNIARLEEQDLEKAVDDLLLKKFTPASVVVTAELDILQFRGNAGLYLEPSPGKASLNLIKMARAGLAFDLRNLVHKAKKTGHPVRKSGFEIVHDGKPLRMAIEAIPLKVGSDEFYLVAFEEYGMYEITEEGITKDKRVQQLEAELANLREDMHSIVESQEAANEELQSANEEVVSSNEELQSINEELETSKEEIESSNEELMTINQELQVRNEQLAESQDYAQVIFSTIGESVIVLDKDLRVKFANKSFYKTFQVNEDNTEGRLLRELGSKQWNIPELQKMLDEILNDGKLFKGMEVAYKFPEIGDKVMRLSASKLSKQIHSSDLIILAFEDITEFRNASKLNAEIKDFDLLRNLSENLPAMIWITGTDKQIKFVNSEWLNFTGLSLDQSIGASWLQTVHAEDVEKCARLFNKSFTDQTSFSCEARMRAANGKFNKVIVKAKAGKDNQGNFDGIIGTCIQL